jgi:hypothetical protein
MLLTSERSLGGLLRTERPITQSSAADLPLLGGTAATFDVQLATLPAIGLGLALPVGLLPEGSWTRGESVSVAVPGPVPLAFSIGGELTTSGPPQADAPAPAPPTADPTPVTESAPALDPVPATPVAPTTNVAEPAPAPVGSGTPPPAVPADPGLTPETVRGLAAEVATAVQSLADAVTALSANQSPQDAAATTALLSAVEAGLSPIASLSSQAATTLATLGEETGELIGRVTDVTGTVVDDVAGTTTTVVDQVGQAAASVVASAADGIADVAAAAEPTVSTAVAAVADTTISVVDTASDILASLPEVATPVAGAVASTIGTILDTTAEVVADVPEVVAPVSAATAATVGSVVDTGGSVIATTGTVVADATDTLLGGADPSAGLQTLLGLLNEDVGFAVGPSAAETVFASTAPILGDIGDDLPGGDPAGALPALTDDLPGAIDEVGDTVLGGLGLGWGDHHG